ncbi:MAG: VOC family protein [Dongiaceae bacterium]
MHRHGLCGFVIDCQDAEIDRAARFWAEALNMTIEPHNIPATGNYVNLTGRAGSNAAGLNIEVQKVKHPSRVHLDIESDDIEAEVRRLEQIGAKIVERIDTWVVMEAPTGHRFCVVRGSYKPMTAEEHGSGSP